MTSLPRIFGDRASNRGFDPDSDADPDLEM